MERKDLTLVIGAAGKTGRRVAERLEARGLPLRRGSRSGVPPFDWDDANTWAPVLQGVTAVYITYYPDLMAPGAVERVRDFAELAVRSGAHRLVLLSGRGEDAAERAEKALRESGADWTILRASWFAQNFSENFFVEGLRAGTLALPAGDIAEPFVDVEDIADVALAALTEEGHVGQLYELTGPRLLTFAEATAEIARASGRDIRYQQVAAADFAAGMDAAGLPGDFVELVMDLFTVVLDGRNASLTDGVQRALGRPPRDFADYAREAAATGVWTAETAAQPSLLEA